MKAGTWVRSITHPDKGSAVVLGTEKFFNEIYVDVFFEKTGERRTLPLTSLVVFSEPLVKIKDGSFSPASRFMLRLLMEQMRAENTQDNLQAAGNFKILPLPHQLLAVSYVLDQLKPRALIADEVGLGKTIEAALIYEELKARGIVKRVLVIAPSGLCPQWRDEMKAKFGEDFVIYDRGTILSLKKLYGEKTNIWTLSDRIITSLDYVKPKNIHDELDERTIRARQWHNDNVFSAMMTAGFDVVIFDEAHKLTKDMTGGETARYKVGKALADVAPVLLLLTATPHQGDPNKFRNLLQLIDPYMFYKNSDVTAENVRKVTVRNNKRAVVDFNGNRIFKQRITSLCLIQRDKMRDKIELELYQAVTDYVTTFYEMASHQNNHTMMFLLLIYQRMVSSSSRAILKSLTARLAALEDLLRRMSGQEQNINQEETNWDHLEDLTAEEQLAELLEAGPGHSAGTLAASLVGEIAALKNCVSLARQATVGRNDVKFTRLLEIINEFKIRENNPRLKFIIFTEFVETQVYLQDCLSNLGYKIALINGRMSTEDKIAKIEFFREEAQFLISTDAGGEGINLQFCHVMINYDLPWNPMRLEQRIGRIDRIGQAHDVKVVNFQLADTVEQRVRDIIESKLAIIRREFNDGEDKLADILSTLQDEFSFEKIYIDALFKRQQAAEGLEAVSRQIFERARKIIEEDRLTLPFSNLEGKYTVSQRAIERKAGKTKQLLVQYLEAYGSTLNQYKQREGFYYFQDLRTGKRMQNIIFQQKYALEHENCELLSLNHPYMEEMISTLDNDLMEDLTARLLVLGSKFKGDKGFLFVYGLAITNYIDPASRYLLPCYVSFAAGKGRVNNRISRYFQDFEQINYSDLVIGSIPYSPDEAYKLARDAVRQQAEVLFFEAKELQAKKLLAEEEKFERYYRDKEVAMNRIAVENIREAKRRELQRDRESKQSEWIRRRQLAPSLSLEQIAYVEFA